LVIPGIYLLHRWWSGWQLRACLKLQVTFS